mmetsp:Transcript_158801/g.281556  ORF Transcript_158801/g.281556 Transcript_158801/m.281556 type:complete len:118 (-) Transcript_158801:165-518(-)
MAQAPGNSRRGQAIFKKLCKQCHSLEPDGRGKAQGPSLWGVIGLPAGSLVKVWGGSGYKLERIGFIWTEEIMKTWLQYPKLVVGDQRGDRSCMSFRGMEAEEDRDDLVAFLCKSGPP